MTLLVTYIDHHWDNHQGGSGKSFEFNVTLNIPESTPAVEVWSVIHEKLGHLTKRNRPYEQMTSKYIITRVELL